MNINIPKWIHISFNLKSNRGSMGQNRDGRKEKKKETLIDLTVIEILSRHTSDEFYLGQRDGGDYWTSDAGPLEAFKRFGNNLEEIEKKLIEKNNDETLRNRYGPAKMPYTLLYPSSEEGLTFRGIPNSISI